MPFGSRSTAPGQAGVPFSEGMNDDAWQNSEELAFIPEQVEPMLTSVIAAVLSNEVYEDSKIPGWIDSICEKSMDSLTELGKPFKYIGIV